MTQVLTPGQETALTTPPASSTTKIVSKRTFIKGDAANPTAVRKLLIIESDGTARPPWVIHYTDYSPDRAKPYQTQIYTAFTPERQVWLTEQILAAEVLDPKGKPKRGWQEIIQPIGLSVETVDF